MMRRSFPVCGCFCLIVDFRAGAASVAAIAFRRCGTGSTVGRALRRSGHQCAMDGTILLQHTTNADDMAAWLFAL